MKVLLVGFMLLVGAAGAAAIVSFDSVPAYPSGIQPPPCPPGSWPPSFDPPNHPEFVVYSQGTWYPPYLDDDGNPMPGAVWHEPGSWGYIGPPH